MPGTALNASRILYPTSLQDLIEICANRAASTRLKAAGSHWALSSAAISDNVFIETHDRNNVFTAMGRRLYEVVPGCLSETYMRFMAAQHPPKFANDVVTYNDNTFYLVHVETGKPWAFHTLGGAGGQTVFGALTTGTHGADFHLPPIVDDVAAIHLVADGAKHYWIEPSFQPGYADAQLTNDDKLNATYGTAQFGGSKNFEIIRDDDLFHAVWSRPGGSALSIRSCCGLFGSTRFTRSAGSRPGRR
jgi:hypothetical protein